MEMNEEKLIKNPLLLKKSLIILGLVITGFLFHGLLKIEASIIALLGASLLLIWTKSDTEVILEKIEWGTILFFIGLFMMVGCLAYTGVISYLAEFIIQKTHGDLKQMSISLMLFSGFFSGILDNIPLVAAFIPTVKMMAIKSNVISIVPVWWSLSLGSCLGGNATIYGASSNIVMLGFAKKNGIKLNFITFFIYGFPVTIISLLISYFYITWRYF